MCRTSLVDPFWNSESLRNRYFRGSRVDKVPLQQLVTAYGKEISDHRNGNLASLLCALWIMQHDDLASVALQCLGIVADEPGNTRTWIGAVHEKLASDQYNVRQLVRTLVQQFPEDDVRIFVSIIATMPIKRNCDRVSMKNCCR